ncbi:hypothetical protein JCM8097_005203 [Rhodosporidiobolus ruineniae]
MRIVTWNVNGIKTLLQYHPWNVKRTYEGILEDLEGDIICIQETKITRAQMDRTMACMAAYDGFFSFYRRLPVKGIHGTAIYTKRETVVPVKAEEGIGSGLLPAAMPTQDRIGGYPLSSEVDLDYNAMKDLDAEGRTTVVDCGMFVIINLYCPNETNSDRLVFKNHFNKMVDQRVRGLIKAGREVIVVGDLNICASDLDTAEPEQRARDRGLENFTDHPPRKWLGEFTGPKGPMIDITRRLHPERVGMFTCWNTKIDARPSNYGTRLDYILITPGLLPWVKFSDIQRDVVGSDHCPVYLDLHDEIDIPGRGTVRIWDELNPGRKKEDQVPDPPAFAARFYSEFSGKQQSIMNFFGKKGDAATPTPLPAAALPSPSPSPQLAPSSAPQPSTSASSSASTSAFSASQPLAAKASTLSTSNGSSKKGKGKEKTPDEEKEKEKKPGQQSLATFFKPPPKPEAPAKKKRKKSKTADDDSPPPSTSARSRSRSASSSQPKPRPPAPASDSDDDILIIDPRDALDGATESSPRPSPSSSSASQAPPSPASLAAASAAATAAINAQSATAWSSIFQAKPPPTCDGHGEPAKLMTVNKTGINKGRRFYLCARPVGPGYDQGQAKLHVDPQWRCDFFQWETSVKRPPGIALDSAAKKRKAT